MRRFRLHSLIALVSVASTSVLTARADDSAWQLRRTRPIDHVEFSPGGGLVLTVARSTDFTPGTLTIYDRVQQRDVFTRSLVGLQAAQFDASGTGIWVGLPGGVMRFDLGTRTLTNERFSEDRRVAGFFRLHVPSNRMAVQVGNSRDFLVVNRMESLGAIANVAGRIDATTVDWAENGQWLAIGARLLRTSDYQMVRTLNEGAVDFSPNGARIAVVGTHGLDIGDLSVPTIPFRNLGFYSRSLRGDGTGRETYDIEDFIPFDVSFNEFGNRVLTTGRYYSSVDGETSDQSFCHVQARYINVARMESLRYDQGDFVTFPTLNVGVPEFASNGPVVAVPGSDANFLYAFAPSPLESTRAGSASYVAGYQSRRLRAFNGPRGRTVMFEPNATADSLLLFVPPPGAGGTSPTKIVGLSSNSSADVFAQYVSSRMVEFDTSNGTTTPSGAFANMPKQVSFGPVTRTDVNRPGTLGAYGGTTAGGARTFEILDLVGKRFNTTRMPRDFGNRAVFVSDTDAVTESGIQQPPVRMLRYRYDRTNNSTTLIGSSLEGDFQVLARGGADGKFLYRVGNRIGLGSISGTGILDTDTVTADVLDRENLADLTALPTEYPVTARMISPTRFRTAGFVANGLLTRLVLQEWQVGSPTATLVSQRFINSALSRIGFNATLAFSPDGETLFVSQVAPAADGSMVGDHTMLRFAGDYGLNAWPNEDGGLPRQAFFAPDGTTVLLQRRDASIIAFGIPPEIASVRISSRTLTSTAPVTITVKLNRAAGSGGARIQVRSERPDVSVPNSVVVPEGRATVTIPVTYTGTFSTPFSVRVSVELASRIESFTLQVTG
ncbi:MAG: hypothetical protein SFX74_04580 [Fimbriimonadaceae bacterium]|nr:hypothetical protein [Fimbriimonadaceae bacterium]